MGDCVKSALGGQRHLVMVEIAVIFISFRNNRTENIKAGTYVEGTQRFIEEKISV